MIVACAILANSILHQTGKAGKNCYRRINTRKGEFAPKHNLSFGDVTGQVRHWMGDVVIRHRKDWNLRDRALTCTDTTCSLVHGGKIAIQITRIPFTAGNLAAYI